MRKIISLFLALFGSSLQMQTGNPSLEQKQIVDQSLDPSKLVGNMQTLETNVNPSSKRTRYDCNSMATESLNLDQESTKHIIMLDTPEFHAVITPELEQLSSAFKKYNLELRIVGLTVRDLLEGKKPRELELATVATRAEVKQMFHKEGIQVVNKNSEKKHGIVTAHINKINFQITTLECVMSTDSGSKDWKTDASRRYLTVNAMYLDFQGILYDYFNGHEDLKTRKVIFIGNPDMRIKEDSTRILEYFRVYGSVAVNPENHDEQTLKAIRENGPALAKISGERLWLDLKRILLGNFSNEIMKKMLDLGLAPYMGLHHPDDLDMVCFDRVCRNADKYSFEPIIIIAALFKTEKEVLTFRDRVKLSNIERDTALYIVSHKNDELPATIKDRLKHFQKSLLFSKIDNKEHCRAFIIELLKVQDDDEVLKMFESWTIPAFPIQAIALKKKGLKDGNIRHDALNKLREVWFDNDFVLDDEILTEVASQFKTKKNDVEKL